MASFTQSRLEHLRGELLDAERALTLDLRGTTDAAVLVPIFFADGDVHVVFTERRNDLSRHAGEISFPGGRRDPGDVDLRATALREAEEEVGLPADHVELIGALQPTPTIATGYAIYPFVGLIESGFQWIPSPTEVAQMIELSVSALRAGYGRRAINRGGLSIRTDTYVVAGHVIWGATARILGDLLDRLGDA